MLQGTQRDVESYAGYLLVDGRASSSRALAEIYREFAVVCVERQIACALVRVGRENYGCIAMRDAFTIMMLAGLPSGFKVAFVTGAQPGPHLLGTLCKDLERLKIDCSVFDDERAAQAWLGSPTKLAAVS